MDNASPPTVLSRIRARGLTPCPEAAEWLGDRTDATQAWADCPRGDWLLWLAGRVDPDRKLIVLAACACARLALPFVKEGETRPLRCIEVTEAWTRGEATMEEVRAARRGAAAAAAYADAAADAADAAAYAAAAARRNMQRQCADAIRTIIPCPSI